MENHLNLILRSETEQDLPFLRELYRSVRWDEFAALTEWSDEQKIAFLDSQFEAQRKHYLNAYQSAQFLIVESKQQAIGRFYVFRGLKDIRVVDIGLLPDYRNCGHGSALLKSVFTEGDTSDRSVSVHVEIFNPARRLYHRLGFKEISQEGPYILMERPPKNMEQSTL